MLNIRNYPLFQNNDCGLFRFWIRSLYSAWQTFMIVVTTWSRGRCQWVYERILLVVTRFKHTQRVMSAVQISTSLNFKTQLYSTEQPKFEFYFLYFLKSFYRPKWRHLIIHCILPSPSPPTWLHFHYFFISPQSNSMTWRKCILF